MLQLYKNIKNRRTKLGMTQSDLAEKTGYADKSMIAKIEKGQVDLPQTKIELFAKALNTTPADLMGWNNNIEKNYYTDPKILKIAQRIFEDSAMHTLFDIAKDMEPERLQAYINFMKSLKKLEEHDVN